MATIPLHLRDPYHWNPSCDTSVEALKVAIINVLTNGEGTCRHCGQGDIDVLTVDHMDGNGAAHRRQVKDGNFYRWIVRNDYPEGFQILCWNCNWKKRMIDFRKTTQLNRIKRIAALRV